MQILLKRIRPQSNVFSIMYEYIPHADIVKADKTTIQIYSQLYILHADIVKADKTSIIHIYHMQILLKRIRPQSTNQITDIARVAYTISHISL